VAWDARNDRLIVSTNVISASTPTPVGTLNLSGVASVTAIAETVGSFGSWDQPVKTTIGMTRNSGGTTGSLLKTGATPAAVTPVVNSAPGPSYMLVLRATRLWSGGSGTWDSAASWTQGIGGATGNAVFMSGSDATPLPSVLTFTGTGGTATNDVAGTPFVGGINFAPDAGAYTLSGNPFTLGLNGNIRNLATAGTQTIAADVALIGSQWIYAEAGSTLMITGAVSGDGTRLTKVGSNVLGLLGSNSYTAGTTVSGGTLVASSASALGSGAVSVAIGGRHSGYDRVRHHEPHKQRRRRPGAVAHIRSGRSPAGIRPGHARLARPRRQRWAAMALIAVPTRPGPVVNHNSDFAVIPVPEPASMTLTGLEVVAAGWAVRRRCQEMRQLPNRRAGRP